MAPNARPNFSLPMNLEELQGLQPPLLVVVNRVRGNGTESIPLLPRNGEVTGGPGWTLDEVRSSLQSEICDIAGGGTYQVQVSDVNNKVTRFGFVLPEDQYPRRMPTTMQGAAAANPPPAVTPGGYSPFNWAPPTYQQQAMQTPISWYPSMSTPINRTPDTSATTEAKQLRDQLHQQQLSQQADRYQAQIVELQRQIAAQGAGPRADDLIRERERLERERDTERRMAQEREQQREALAAVQRQAAEQVAALKAQMEREQADRRAEADRRAAEDARREAERRFEAQLAADRKATDDKFAAMLAQMQQLIATNAQPRGPDPMISMLIEQQRTAAEAAREAARIDAETKRETARLEAETAKETARAQAEAAREAARAAAETERIRAAAQEALINKVHTMMQPNQMSPMEAARVVKEAGQGADAVTRTMMGTMQDMMQLQSQFTANMLQMAPQGGSTAERIVETIADVAKDYGKSQAQAAAAQAAAQAQAAAAAARAQQPVQWAPPQWVGEPQPQPEAPPMNGAPPVNETWAPPPPIIQPPLTAGDGGLNGPPVDGTPTPAVLTPVPAAVAEPTRHGKTDVEWFGPALPDMLKLRELAAVYLKTLEDDTQDVAVDQLKPDEPPTIVDAKRAPIGGSPALVADAIMTSAGVIVQRQIKGILAFDYLWGQQMYPALVDVLLPDAPDEFRKNVLHFLHRKIAGEPLWKDGDPMMYGIEIDDGDDDDAPAPPAPRAPVPPPASATRQSRGGGAPRTR